MDRHARGAKTAIRKRLLAARAAIDDGERRSASVAVARHLDAIIATAACRTALGYAATGSELVVDAWLEERMAAGVGVFLPFVQHDDLRGSDLGIARVRNLDADLAPGWRGVREPAPAQRRPARVDRVDVFVVPGVGFDRAGARLGYGGGHFDRLLARAGPNATLIGVGFAVQIVDELPLEPHDVRVDYVITEAGVIRAPAAGMRPAPADGGTLG